MFAFRPQYNDCWEYRIWLQVDPDGALQRGMARDTAVEEAIRLHRDRYGMAERSCLADVNPRALADIVIDNTDFRAPRIVTADGG